MTKTQAKILYDYYTALLNKLIDAKTALVDGGVKSYTIGDRTLTRFDLKDLTAEIDEALKKQAEMLAILEGRRARKAVAVVPRDW